MADSIVAPYGLETNNPVPEIKRYFNLAETPYTSTAQVLSEVLLAVRYKGQTFNVNEEEWWFKEGTADGDLVLKLSALSSNLTDGQELDLPYVGSQTFTLPDNYLVVSVFKDIGLYKKLTYTRSLNTITVIEPLLTGDTVNIRGLVATGSFTPVTPPSLEDVTSQGSSTSVPIQSPNAVNPNELTSLGQVEGLIAGIPEPTFLNLTDVIPSTYTGQAGKYPKVNAGETGLEFDDVGGSQSFEDVLQVNRTATTSPLIPNATEPTGAVNLQQLQASQKLHAVFIDNNLDGSVSLTGTTAITIVKPYVFPANYFPSDCVVEVSLKISKKGTAGNMAVSFGKDGSSITLPIHLVSATAANLQMPNISRSVAIKNGVMVGLGSSGSFYNDNVAISVGIARNSFDVTVSQTFNLTFQLGNASDTMILESLILKVYKNV